MDVGTYINKLLGNDALRERIVKHRHPIIQLLSHPACEIIRQIEFHPDYVEVSGRKFFQLSARSFTECPPNMELGKISPRMFMPYGSTTPPQPLYFKNGVKNSFPELPERTAFLNKFYQCFVGCRMPHKIRKLVVSGPKDSGKTSLYHQKRKPEDEEESDQNEVEPVSPGYVPRPDSGWVLNDETYMAKVYENIRWR